MKKVLTLFLVCCATLCTAQEQITQLQTTSDPMGSFPDEFYAFNNTALFLATGNGTGREIWKSDGTAGGTVLLKDINLGVAGSVSSNFVELNARLYFIADDGLTGSQLWSTHGSDDGTIRVTDNINYRVRELVVHGDHIYYLKQPQRNRLEVWKTNGTPDGTVLVKGDIPIWNTAYNLFSALGLVFFTAQDEGSSYTRVWRTDGTEEGTFSITGPLDGNGAGPGGTSHPTQFVEYNGAVYFIARSGFSNGLSVGIVKLDGTVAGTQHVVGIHSGNMDLIEFADVIVHNDKMYFSFFDADRNRFFVWQSAGLEGNTVSVYDYTGASYFVPSYMCSLGEHLYFTSGNADSGTSLWRINAATGGQEEIKALAGAISKPFIFSDDYHTNTILADENRIFVRALQGDPEYAELWLSNGTADGTFRLTRATGRDRNLMIAAGQLFFAGGAGRDFELWKTDGTPAGTALVKDIYTSAPAGIGAAVRQVNDAAFFVGATSDYGTEPWLTDGTAAGTRCLDLFPGKEGSWPLAFVNTQNKLYFVALAEAKKLKVYSSDGTSDGTGPVSEFTTPDWFVKVVEKGEGDVFVSAMNAGGTYSLYSLNPLTRELVEVRDFGRNEYNSAYRVTEMVSMNNTIYLLVSGAGTDLWKSDGTNEGTVKVADFFSASRLTVAGNRLYLVAPVDPLTDEKELYSTDGTSAGTAIVKNINGAGSAMPENLFPFHDRLVFTAFDQTSGKEVWITDGKEEGTTILKDINPGPASSVATPLFTLHDDGALYFTAHSAAHGSELWKTDGTTEGTAMLKDIVPGAESSKPAALSYTGGKLYFSAYTPEHGYEIWSTDGTAEGTSLVVDVLPGPEYSNPTSMVMLNDVLVFAADSESHGRQLWRYQKEAITSITDGEDTPLNVYPNPSSGVFKVDAQKFSGGTLAVYNAHGSCLTTIALHDADEVDLSHMPSGLYLMKFRKGATLKTVKAIKF